MAETLIEQLDKALELIWSDPTGAPDVPEEVESLLGIAVELRALPRESFKVKLKEDLMSRASMASEAEAASEKPMDFIREGFHTITPYLAVREAPELIEFVKRAFGAQGEVHGTGSEGGIHAEYKIGDSIVMIGGGSAWKGSPKVTALHIYVDDVDVVYQRALDAGATSMMGPIEAHGERVAGVKDISGNEWYIAKRLAGSHTDEGLHNVNVYLHPQSATQMIEFLKLGFGAEEIMRHQPTPEGPVLHAKVRIGSSVIEMGDARGLYQTLPSMFYLYVDDVEAWHQRAVAGGATSFEEPRDQPYGDRVGAVTDPFGNTWYLATHIKELRE